MKNNFLAFGKPYLKKSDIAEVVDTLRSGWWSTGPKTEKFEYQFRQYVGAKYSLAVNSATAGLHLSLIALGVGVDDEVITTPLTFAATANAIVHCGAKPVFVDVDLLTWNIDPRQIEKKITKKTKAIIPVHLHGRPCDMEAILSIARCHHLYVIEDAAHAVEAWHGNKKIGNVGDITVFSFYVTKNIAAGEGGMITSNNKNWIEKMRMLSFHGLSHSVFSRYTAKKFVSYQCLLPGYKYNMTDIAASLGIHQLSRVEKNWRIRAKQWRLYDIAFSKLSQLSAPEPMKKKSGRHAHHLYAILLHLDKLKINRNQFIAALRKRNIGAGVHFVPLHHHPFYQKQFGYSKKDFPIATDIGNRIVSLPLGPAYNEVEIKQVAKEVAAIVEKYAR